MLMNTHSDAQDEMRIILEQIGIMEQSALTGMHLSEITEEASNILDLVSTFRVFGRQGDVDAAQGALGELTIALEHLLHHTQALLPLLQNELEIEPDLELEGIQV